jgi:hypothetical protein
MREVELINDYFADETDGEPSAQQREEETRRMLRHAERDVEQAEHDAAVRGVAVLDQLAVTVTDEDRLGAARKLIARKQIQAELEAEGKGDFVVPGEAAI